MSHFFCNASFDEEINRKIASRSVSATVLMGDLIAKLKTLGLPNPDIQTLEDLYRNFLRNGDEEQIQKTYLSHPIRVAASYANYCVPLTVLDMILALTHNLKEKMGDTYSTLASSVLPEKIKTKIEILTINRASEKDPVYLNEFYGAIETVPGLMLLKTLDKLDNTLIWPLLDLEESHSRVVFDFVCPRIEKTHPSLGDYLRRLTHYVSLKEVKEKFRSRIAGTV